MATLLDQLSAEVTALSGKVAPAVVGVGRGGSGVVLGEGIVVTNAHNLRGEEVTVRFADGRQEKATAAGVDAEGDLAVLRVDTGGLTPLSLAETEVVAGTAVVALANPGGWGVRSSFGMVSAVDVSFRGPGGRVVTGAFEHSAPLVRGSSGGAVVDAAGTVVGINTHRSGEGFYIAFATGPGLKQRIDSLARGESPKRVRLGIAVAPTHVARRLRQSVGLAPRDGVLVHAVDPDGPAGRAGIGRGDLVVSVGGTAVADVDELASALEAAGAPGTIAVVVVRGAEELTVSVELPG